VRPAGKGGPHPPKAAGGMLPAWGRAGHVRHSVLGSLAHGSREPHSTQCVLSCRTWPHRFASPKTVNSLAVFVANPR